MAKKRDYQRQRVTDWQWDSVNRWDELSIPFAQLQVAVNYIWEDEGLKYPPTVASFGKKVNTEITLGQANRETVTFPGDKKTQGLVLMHELAHSMNEDAEGNYRGLDHGPEWLGLYMKLIHKHLGIPMISIITTAAEYSLHYDLDVKPIDIDNPPRPKPDYEILARIGETSYDYITQSFSTEKPDELAQAIFDRHRQIPIPFEHPGRDEYWDDYSVMVDVGTDDGADLVKGKLMVNQFDKLAIVLKSCK